MIYLMHVHQPNERGRSLLPWRHNWLHSSPQLDSPWPQESITARSLSLLSTPYLPEPHGSLCVLQSTGQLSGKQFIVSLYILNYYIEYMYSVHSVELINNLFWNNSSRNLSMAHGKKKNSNVQKFAVIKMIWCF